MRALLVNESANFERGQDPKKAMGIGSRAYPNMPVREFVKWFQKEIVPYFNSDFDAEGLVMDVVNDEESSDDELRERWAEEEAPKEIINQLLDMRSYFWDWNYVQHI